MKRKEQKVDEYGNIVEKSALGTAFNVLVGLIAIAIFLVVFIRMYQARDSEISNDIIMDRGTYRIYSAGMLKVKLPDSDDRFHLFQPVAKAQFVCYSLYPSTTMDKEGRIQVREVYYLDSADNLQLTVRLNTRYYSGDYDFVLRVISNADGSERYCSDSYAKTDVRMGYTFIRIAFTGLSIGENETVRLQMLPKGAQPGDSAYINIKVYGSDIYAQTENIAKLDVQREIIA